MHALVYLCGLTKGFMAKNYKRVVFTLHIQHCILLYWTGDTFDWFQIRKCVTRTWWAHDGSKRLNWGWRAGFIYVFTCLFPVCPMWGSAVVEGVLKSKEFYFEIFWRSCIRICIIHQISLKPFGIIWGSTIYPSVIFDSTGSGQGRGVT